MRAPPPLLEPRLPSHGNWGMMGGQDSLQEHDTSYRYQLSAMAYAAGAAHYHRLPAMRSLFKPLILKLIHKMLRREVWSYWYMTSQSGPRIDPDLKELRKPWADPVCRENIMYSGHVLLMTSLYAMLFNDSTFDEPDSLVFTWDPCFFGMGPEEFKYNRLSLQKTILKQMEEGRWMGVCCEPNMVFIVCNQFPLIATRYTDVFNHTNVLGEVLPKYKAAWAKRGMIAENGLFVRNYAPGRDHVINTDQVGHSGWISAFLVWTDIAKQNWSSIISGFLHKVDNRINIRPAPVAKAIRDIVKEEGGGADEPAVVQRAQKSVLGKKQPPGLKYLGPVFGHIAQGMSEVAGSLDLDALLLHADTYLQPTWENGGLYYAQNWNQQWDEQGNYTYGEPYTGNAAIGYARLNVNGGQKQMFEHPWTREQVDQAPWIDGIDLGLDVDCRYGKWDEKKQAMFVVLRTWNAEQEVKVKAMVRNLPVGVYGVYVDGGLSHSKGLTDARESVGVELVVGAEDVEVVLLMDR